MTEQDAAKLAAIRERTEADAIYYQWGKPSHYQDKIDLLRMLDEANELADRRQDEMLAAEAETSDWRERAGAANEDRRQMREAIVEYWEAFTVSDGDPEWMRRLDSAENSLRAIAASPPSGESALRKAARYEAALREIADATACPCHCPTVMELAAAALEGGGP